MKTAPAHQWRLGQKVQKEKEKQKRKTKRVHRKKGCRSSFNLERS
jgi:hypothetical protein